MELPHARIRETARKEGGEVAVSARDTVDERGVGSTGTTSGYALRLSCRNETAAIIKTSAITVKGVAVEDHRSCRMSHVVHEHRTRAHFFTFDVVNS